MRFSGKFWLRASHRIGAELLSQGYNAPKVPLGLEKCASELIHMIISALLFLSGWWLEASVLHHRAAHNIASGLPQSKRSKEAQATDTNTDRWGSPRVPKPEVQSLIT